MVEELEKLKKELEEIKNKIEKLEKQEKKRWRAEEGNDYYFINDCGNISWSVEDNGRTDNFRHFTRNYFKTGEEAQKHLDKLKTYFELMDLADELNNREEIDWKDIDQAKYFIFYNTREEKLLKSVYFNIKFSGVIYCLDENFLEKAKERIGEERLLELFKED